MSTGDTWGNLTASAAIDAGIRASRANTNQPALCAPGPVHLMGVSMGGTSALMWALRNPGQVKSIILLIGAINIQYTYDLGGGFATEMDGIFGGRPKDHDNPYSLAEKFQGIPIQVFYSTTDTVTDVDDVLDFCDRSGAVPRSMGAQGHFWAAPFSADEINDWFQTYDGERRRPYRQPDAYARLVRAQRVAAYWPLDDPGFGEVGDFANGRYPAALEGIEKWGNGDGPAKRRGPGALSTIFDDVGRITTTYNPFANGSVRTFSGWAYRYDDENIDTLFAGSQGGQHPILYVDSGNNDVGFRADQGGGELDNFSGAWPGTEQWVHWALVFDEPNNLAHLYINGEFHSSVTHSVAYNASPGFLTIGGYATSAHAPTFDGGLAHVAVFERGLTPGEIKAQAKAVM
jgi:pimeloyl-ACP methyl ester carboxylesterase